MLKITSRIIQTLSAKKTSHLCFTPYNLVGDEKNHHFFLRRYEGKMAQATPRLRICHVISKAVELPRPVHCRGGKHLWDLEARHGARITQVLDVSLRKQWGKTMAYTIP